IGGWPERQHIDQFGPGGAHLLGWWHERELMFDRRDQATQRGDGFVSIADRHGDSLIGFAGYWTRETQLRDAPYSPKRSIRPRRVSRTTRTPADTWPRAMATVARTIPEKMTMAGRSCMRRATAMIAGLSTHVRA